MADTKVEVKKETKVSKVTKETKVVKTEAKVEVKKAPAAAPKAVKTGGLTVTSYSVLGKEAGTLELPKSLFGETVNEKLLAQAIRIYTNNQLGHWTNTKTRGEVKGSTRKIYKQKGTGRARHGSIMAPIFVGGGIALGPKSRKTVLELPKKMRAKAIVSALSDKLLSGEVIAISGIDKVSGKTREFAQFLPGIQKKSALIVVDSKQDLAVRAVKNIRRLDIITAEQLNLLEIVKHQSLVFTREAVEKLQERIFKAVPKIAEEAK